MKEQLSKTKSLEAIADTLIKEANQNGGTDNISVVLGEVTNA